MEIEKMNKESIYFNKLIDYAKRCSWIAGPHLADMLVQDAFSDWESAFAAILDGKIVGYCTFMKTDYYPENRYYPWISTIFVDEAHRGNRISEKLINAVIVYAKEHGFNEVYIPSDMLGFYEKYGFERIDQLENYDGDMDYIFRKEI